ncbi:MAG: hypothetical protein KAT05_13370, partial [Spirochaetes bacterium]|nr:hypothetical protein [Spirochaetota bacterium]
VNMVLGSDVVSGIIREIFPTEIAYGIIIVGFGIFFLYFFGTDEWGDFSDLEKIIYSIITGWLLWFIVIYPISMGYETLKLYFTYTNYTDISDKTIGNFNVFASLIFMYFFIGRLLSDTPLFKNKDFIKLTHYLILFIIIILYTSQIFIFFSFQPTQYGFFAQELENRTLIIIILLANLWIIFLKVNGNLKFDSMTFFDEIKNKLCLKFNSNKHIFEKLNSIRNISIILILFVLGSYLTGYMFFNPSVADKNFEIKKLEIRILPIDKNFDEELPGSLFIENQVEVSFGWVKWVYIPQYFTINKAYNTDNESKKYKISGNGVVIRGNETENITIEGYQKINVSNNFYNFTIEDLNDTQIWNISFINPYQYDIKIKELVIRNPKDLKLIEWTNNDYVYLDWTNFNENINKSPSELTS